ncbi:DUF4843 domain-containing protein [Olivibacter sp. SDN3]|uniref:DUF4843 domain-containing protein n=1 Tax=Olivibacter sp. SDN3 TaxID=2764720 RepID=UPI001651697F|nr:DUF4843 domain-containing protein [Olivibacter sp. SDN3]QNL51573.1 DUF4843 domain-containing protein [Olivibacter sp. SDN3]
MKRLKYIISLVAIPLFFTACMKETDEDFYFRDAIVEFEDATTGSNVAGKNYPLLTTLTRDSGEKEYRINLLGEQLGENQALAFRIVDEETTAEEGVHFNLPEGNIATLPANSSFAYLKIDVPDFAPSSGNVQLVLELTGNEHVKPSERYKKIGLQINLE